MPEPPATRFTVRRMATIDSTNRHVVDAARAGAPEGLVVVADRQTAGRGRLGRPWIAPPRGSLLLSVLLRPQLSAEQLHLVTMAVALAMADAVEEVAGFAPELKWPNDLLVGDRKLAGILCEADIGALGEVRAVVAGIGVNVQWEEVPSEIADVATSCNLEAGRDVSRHDLLDAFLADLDVRLAALEDVAVDYRARLATIGRRVRADTASGAIVGVAVDVDSTGALLVETAAGRIEVVSAGDVAHLRVTRERS